MTEEQKIQEKLDTLILIELLKRGATRDQVRKVLGAISNETFAKVNAIFKKNQNA